MAEIINFVSNNANGLRSSKKRIKIFEYLKSKIFNDGIIFLQESHSSENTQNEWINDFKGELYFSHGTTNSCGVVIAFVTRKKVSVSKVSKDKKGRILILEVTIEDSTFVLINLYNANTEPEQIETICELDRLLGDFLLDDSKNIILAGDLNLIFDSSLEASGGTPTLKKKSISKFLQFTGKHNLVDIWRIRNPNSKRFTFRKNHFSGFIQRRLDYAFVSNNLQENLYNFDILPSFCSDHSPLFFSYKSLSCLSKGNNFWKFNCSLTLDNNYVNQMKDHIKHIKNEINVSFTENFQSQWEFLKYEIRKFTISYSKAKARKDRERKQYLENKLKLLEQKNDLDKNNTEYDQCKQELSKIYDEISNGIKVRSRCEWYEFGEKSNKFFLNLEKHRASQNTIKKIFCDGKEITDINKINSEIFRFYKGLFKDKIQCNAEKCRTFLKDIQAPSLTNEQKNICEGELLEKEIYDALTDIDNNKSPGNDGLTKEFYYTFWNDIKDVYISSIRESKTKKVLSTSQRQAIIKLIEKPNKDKRFIENWRPISLLNVDQKIISKALASRLKKVLPFLIGPGQTAYVDGRFIGESGRLIADIIETSDLENIEGYLLAIDFEKAFDSLNHNLLIAALEKFGFGCDFIDWIKILINKQESCVINNGKTTTYFNLERGARQGDPISAYLFILVLEFLLLLAKSCSNICGIKLFQHEYLYTAYADDTTFFLKDKVSVKKIFSLIDNFSKVSGLRPNIKKCEIAGIGVLKNVNVALCGMKNVNLTKETIKILGVHLSYNKKLQDEKNFCDSIKNIVNVLKLWRMRSLTLEGKITIFKSLAISKIVYLALLTPIPNVVVDELKQIQKTFLWGKNKPKIKNDTLCNEYNKGGLKNVDITLKIVSLKCSWVKRLCDANFHEWKLIPMHYITKFLGKGFKFHSNVKIPKNTLDLFPHSYKEILNYWGKTYSQQPNVPSTIASQFLWFNNLINIDNSVVFFKDFSESKINYVSDIFDDKGNLKTWETIQTQYKISKKFYFKWLQLTQAIPRSWKKELSQDDGRCRNLLLLNHHLIKNNQLYLVEKLNSRELYSFSIYFKNAKPSSQLYFENYFCNDQLLWNDIYAMPRIVTIDSSLRCFQCKILQNVLYLNEKLFLSFLKKQIRNCVLSAKVSMKRLFIFLLNVS